MKKITALALAALMLFAVGCGGSAPAQQAAPAQNAAQTATEAPTAAPTEAPTPEPTAAPAAAWEVTASGVNIWTNRATFGYAWAQIANTGDVPLYMAAAPADLERSDGSLYKSLAMVSAFPQVLLPGETGVYGEQFTVDEPEDGLSLVSRFDIQPAKVEAIRLDVTDVELKADNAFGIKMQGRVVNSTDEAQSLIYVAALLYDADGAFLGSMRTILSGELPAGEKQGFELQGLGTVAADAADVASWEVYAYPNQYQF